MFSPMISNSGLARSKSAAAPPTMIARVPPRAPTSPPDTGASRAEQPRAAAAIRFASDGSEVVMSISSVPGAALATIPL